MVTASNKNWEKHKQEVYEKISNKYGAKAATKFMQVYCSRYDKFNRSFIDYNLAFWLMDDMAHVNKIGTKWYAFLGVGGVGKTTILKNVFYFLDNTFEPKRLSTDIREFITHIAEFETVNAGKAVAMDEPDDDIGSQSKAGKKLRKIFGKIRQQKLFLGICATDLKDIPPYIFRKLDGIIFCPVLGEYWFFKNRPKQGSYILQEIRNQYSEKGYKVFQELKNRTGCLRGHTMAGTPFNPAQEQGYLKDKAADFRRDLTEFVAFNAQDVTNLKKDWRPEVVRKFREMGLKDAEIAPLVGLTRQRVQQLAHEELKQTANSINIHASEEKNLLQEISEAEGNQFETHKASNQ